MSLFHGVQDRNVPIALVRVFVRNLPIATLTEFGDGLRAVIVEAHAVGFQRSLIRTFDVEQIRQQRISDHSVFALICGATPTGDRSAGLCS